MELSIQYGRWWGTQLKLTSWAGYQSRLGDYGSINSTAPSVGTVTLIFAPEGRSTDPLTARETWLISWFLGREPTVSASVKEAIIRWCSPDAEDRRRRFDFDDGFPTIENEEDLRLQIGLYAINIHQVEHGDIPYIGYEFGCDWEEEHGLGVLMHGTRLVEVGLADTALLLWLAEKDARATFG